MPGGPVDVSGGKPRDSQRYRQLIVQARGIIKTGITTALNRQVAIHAPMEIVVARLDFRMPGLSRRRNRIIANCGRAVFKGTLADLKERLGIEVAEVNSACTSRECEPCGGVDRRNRKSQSEFRCLHCGYAAHADVQGAKIVANALSSHERQWFRIKLSSGRRSPGKAHSAAPPPLSSV